MKFARAFLFLLLLLVCLPKGTAENASSPKMEPGDLKIQIRSHMLKGETTRGIELLNRYISATRVYEKRPISQFLINQITRYGIKEEAARYPYFTPGDAEYIKKGLFYFLVARQITRGLAGDEAKVHALLDWTSSHIQSSGSRSASRAVSSIVKEDEIDFPTFPRGIMQRGYGLCSRKCWVLSTLARSLGYSAGVMYLRSEEDLVSHHTLSWVIINDGLYLFDPYTGVPILTPDGSPAPYLDCLERPEIIDNFRILGQGHWMKGADLKNAIIWIVASPRSLLPRMAILQEVLNEAPDAPVVWTDLEAEVQKVHQVLAPNSSLKTLSLPLRFPGKRFYADLWFFPFGLEASSTRDSFQKKRKEAHKFLEFYARARRRHLLGNYQEAFEEYTRAFNSNQECRGEPLGSLEVREDVEFFLALFFLDMGKAPEAAERFEKYLEEYPQGFWRPLSLLNLARALEEMGEREKAIETYKKVPKPMALGARFRAQRLLKK